jgi:hypothetical protein
MSENLEKMETIENGEIDVIDDVDYTEVEGGSGKVIGLVVAGLTGAAALGAVAYKKIKAKKDGQPKKKRKKLMWVEVEDDIEENDVVDSEAKEVEEEKETEE